jgi:SAM-dependent methyltransferase
VKTTADGRSMLNLACGTIMHSAWNNLDFSPYARLKRFPVATALARRAGILSVERYQRLQGVCPDVICWDLARGIPFADNTFDAVYHSHFLEHLRKEVAPGFLAECRRVLRSSGVLRVVVPDLYLLASAYVEAALELLKGRSEGKPAHAHAVEMLFDQMVREDIRGTTEQRTSWQRRLERLIRGDATTGGERHWWMYDQFSLGELLASAGFGGIRRTSAEESSIEGWPAFSLDAERDGTVRKPESLYMEAVK